MSKAYTVTQINSYIKNMFRQDFMLNNIMVKGEVSNCKYHSSGHIYFTIKDSDATISAIMFVSSACKMDFIMKDGMQVVVTGRIDVYERDGKYQLYATNVEAEGTGDLYKKFEELKNYFMEMGYFEKEYKRKIPFFSKKIGIVTAQTGAAIQDIMNISYRRNPYVSLVLYPAIVQGKEAAASIVTGIRTLDAMNLDVIIVGRGGGSIEDLWAFNEEIVAETIFNSNTPIISAVGHETDFTIADFVADMRAPTPSAAAELAVADIRLIEATIRMYEDSINKQMNNIVSQYRKTVEVYNDKLKYLNPIAYIDEKKYYLSVMAKRIDISMSKIYKEKKHLLQLYAARLEGLSPLNKLSQGYSYAMTEAGTHIASVENVKKGDKIQVYLKDGYLKAKITDVKEID